MCEDGSEIYGKSVDAVSSADDGGFGEHLVRVSFHA